MASTDPTLGKLLKTYRARKNWTLKEMSEQSGIPLSTLSKIEHDRLTLTYDKLLQLSQRLNIPISELFSENRGADPAITGRRSIGRLEDAVRVETDSYDYYYLCTELRKKRMIPIVTRIRARSLAEFGDLVTHEGEEFIYVLDGSIEVHTEYYDPVVLEAGQSIYIDSQMGHAYLAHGDTEEATVLGVCSSDDPELMHALLNINAKL